jgi:hypothetical protein
MRLESRVDPLDFAVLLQYKRVQGLRLFCVLSTCSETKSANEQPKTPGAVLSAHFYP